MRTGSTKLKKTPAWLLGKAEGSIKARIILFKKQKSFPGKQEKNTSCGNTNGSRRKENEERIGIETVFNIALYCSALIGSCHFEE